ncbi:MAG: hypothetical protein ACP5I1_20415 [Candidatus Hinthialibacter sp.]
MKFNDARGFFNTLRAHVKKDAMQYETIEKKRLENDWQEMERTTLILAFHFIRQADDFIHLNDPLQAIMNSALLIFVGSNP